ncbi:MULTISPECIES: hypothetical protein [unclassified Leptolyngbya]|uniref:hypothetical protein n=1 Tax=unclassified Leptolyngbya TaxID=2650499 RepID=UPI0016883F62|nr:MULTISPECIES: hypothetical protein [unclassified Leptolyngbya]MBD1910020.1 hypothetical protein [Leptolyngbya sp. FACHB-8]MBD2156842.1 hypothetical protein [Leptolyngbya sp. FACHB-16]
MAEQEAAHVEESHISKSISSEFKFKLNLNSIELEKFSRWRGWVMLRDRIVIFAKRTSSSPRFRTFNFWAYNAVLPEYQRRAIQQAQIAGQNCTPSQASMGLCCCS